MLLAYHQTFFSAEYSAKMDCTAYSGSSVSGSPNKFLVDDGLVVLLYRAISELV